MRYLFIIVMLFFFTNSLIAQFSVCGTTSSEEVFEKTFTEHTTSTCASTTVNYGRNIPSKDTLRITVIFAKFPDDDDEVYWWPHGTFPALADSILDFTVAQGSTNAFNLTNYYRTMSRDSLIVIGNTVKVISESLMNDYSGSNHVSNANNAGMDLLSQLYNSQPGLALFDDWKGNSKPFCKESDDIVDLVVFIWRSQRFGADYGGFAYPGWRSFTDQSTNQQVKVRVAHVHERTMTMLNINNNITLPTIATENQIFGLTVHEIGHHLLSFPHPHNQNGGNDGEGRFRIPSMLSEIGAESYVANPYEQEFLGWIDVLTITNDISLELDDYISTGQAIKISEPSSTGKFYFFNYDNNHPYKVSENINDSGIFSMYHHSPRAISSINAYSSFSSHTGDNENRLISSEGDYDWEQVNPFFLNRVVVNGPINRGIFNRVSPNRLNGSSHLAKQLRTDPCLPTGQTGHWWIYATGNADSTGTAPNHGCYNSSDFIYFADTTYSHKGHGYISSFSYENNRAYWSPITNPMPKTFQFLNSTTDPTPLNLSMHVGPKVSGSVPVTFKFNEDPFVINSPRTWSGEIYIPDDQAVGITDTLTILPGTRVFFGKGMARIHVSGGGKIIAIGTQDKPITFTTMYPTDPWNHANEWRQIYLASGGNHFEWAIFEYGNKHIEIASRGNVIKNSIFRNGWRGISSYSNQSGSGGSKSEVELDQVLFSNNRTIGIVGYLNDSYIHNVTVSGNGQAGVWYSGSNGLSFHSNLIEENAQTSSSRYGIEVLSNSSTLLLNYIGNYGYYGEGRNVIRNQPTSQILVSGSGAYLNMGFNTGYDMALNSTTGGSSFLVRNTTSSTVYAHENWWGGHPVNSSWFYGPIDYSLPLSSAPTFSAGANNLPNESYLYSNQYLKELPSGGRNQTQYRTEFVERLRNSSEELREKLRTEGVRADQQDILHFAHVIALMWDPEHFKEDQQKNEQVLEELYNSIQDRLANENGSISFSENEQAIVEVFLKYTFSKNPEQAYTAALPLVTRSLNTHVELAASWASFYYTEQKGQTEDAITHLNRIVELEQKHGLDDAIISSIYDTHIDFVLNRTEYTGDVYYHKESDGVEKFEDNQADSPVEVSVYPNPFNPITLLRISLPVESRVNVEVYNILGQRVAVLANETMSAGSHTFRLDGTNMASGIYLIRTTIGHNSEVRRVTLLK